MERFCRLLDRFLDSDLACYTVHALCAILAGICLAIR